MSSSDSAASAAKVSAERGATLSTIRNLWPYMWPENRPDLRLKVVLAIAALLASKVATTLVPFAYKALIDAFSHGTAASPAIFGVAIAIVLVIAWGVATMADSGFQQLRDILFASVGQHAVRGLALRTFQHLHRMSLRYHLQRRMGGLSRVIERGTKGIENVIRFAMLNTIPTIIEFIIVGTIFLVMFGVSYLAVLVVTIVAYVSFTVVASNRRIVIRRDMNSSDTDASSKAVDSLLNYETVKYFGNEDMEARRFDVSMAGYERAAVRIWTSLGFLNFGQAVIFFTGTMVVLILSAQRVMTGEQTLGDFVLLNSFMMQIYRPLNFIGVVYREIRQGLTDIEAMFDLLGQDLEIADRPGARPLELTGPVVRFEHVSFAYDPDRPILKDVSFEIPAGKTVAVVGPSGAGKSTLARLIYRFYDVTAGSISIDGQDVRDVTQQSLRAAIGMVPQDTVLFNDTIGYNIRYGRTSASDADVAAAAQSAQIARFVAALPQGYATPVGERGLKLSGGEKQRVAIARTILKGPPILLLDEATSALDTKTEQDIQSALDAVSANRTTLVIAHRLSTVIGADEIIVLRDGQIAERGTHGELMGSAGLYAEMWRRQREATEAEELLRKTANDSDGFVRVVVPAAE